MHRLHHYAKIWILLIPIFVLTLTQRSAAQEPLVGLRLLAWPAGGAFLLGATPSPVMTLPDGSTQQTQILWRLAADGSERRQLAVGFNPQRSPDGRLVTFSQLDAQNQLSAWGIDLETGALQPLGISSLSTADLTMAGDPPGRVYVSPDGKKRAILVNEFFTAGLWVGEENAPVQLILSSDGELFSDLSWRADGEALAFIRTPLGSQTDTGGELWRIDLSPSGNALTRLSQNNVVDRSPVWSADGTRLTVVRNEQMVVAPSNQLTVEEFTLPDPAATLPGPAPIGPAAQLIPPTEIRVIHHASNTCRLVPVGQIDTIPLEEYVKRVVPYEVPPSWPAETLKAQAVAARTYGWDKYLQNPGGSFHVTDWVNHQVMCDSTFPSTNQAVDETGGEYLAYNGQVITAMFSAENSSPTKTNPNVNYLQAVDDPVSFGETRNGHGYGMGQWGAQRWADQHQWPYQAILRHYYSNVTLEEAGAPTDTAPPNVSLIVPWSKHYLTGNNLWLLINTSDDGGSIAQTKAYLTTPSETNLLLSEAGPANQAGYVVDISGWADRVLLGNTLVLTAEAFDITGKRGASPPVTIGLDRIAPTAFLTTATTLSGTTVITDSPVVSLTLTSFDITAGATYIALGRKEWEWEGESLTREEMGGQPVGQVVCDSAAFNGLAMQATVAGDAAGHWSSDEITLPAPNQYRAYFRVKVSNFTISNEVAQLEVIDNQSGALIGLHRLHGTDFRASDAYQEFHVDFDYQTAIPAILRLNFQDTAGISLDRIIVVEYPIPYTNRPTYDDPNFRLKVIDKAGNVSDDLLVLPLPPSIYRVYLPLIIRSGGNLPCNPN